MTEDLAPDKHRLERFLADLDQNHTLVQPIDERIKQTEDLSLSFARLALTNLFVLNGGGLGAMPAFAAFLSHPATGTAFSTLLPSAGAFVVSLLSTMASTMLA